MPCIGAVISTLCRRGARPVPATWPMPPPASAAPWACASPAPALAPATLPGRWWKHSPPAPRCCISLGRLNPTLLIATWASSTRHRPSWPCCSRWARPLFASAMPRPHWPLCVRRCAWPSRRPAARSASKSRSTCRRACCHCRLTWPRCGPRRCSRPQPRWRPWPPACWTSAARCCGWAAGRAALAPRWRALWPWAGAW